MFCSLYGSTYEFIFPKFDLLQGLIEAESKIEPALKDLLTKSGAEDYIPVFATRNVTLKQLSFMNDKELSEVRPINGLNYSSNNTIFS